MSGGQYVACNAAAETIYERPRPQIIGHNPMTFSAPIRGDGRPAEEHVPERAQQALREGFARFEWLNLRPNGETQRCIVMLIPIRLKSPTTCWSSCSSSTRRVRSWIPCATD